MGTANAKAAKLQQKSHSVQNRSPAPTTPGRRKIPSMGNAADMTINKLTKKR
jgi:hypothetical protein